MGRLIRQGSRHSRTETIELLQSVFALELMCPSDKLWLVSPWISDIPIIDNRGDTFKTVEKWGPERISLSRVLVALASRGTNITVVTITDKSNLAFLSALKDESRRRGVEEKVVIKIDDEEKLHEKAITSSDFVIDGSMNFTFNGLFIRRERINFEINPQLVAETRLTLAGDFNGE
jgi:hypothetical protein